MDAISNLWMVIRHLVIKWFPAIGIFLESSQVTFIDTFHFRILWESRTVTTGATSTSSRSSTKQSWMMKGKKGHRIQCDQILQNFVTLADFLKIFSCIWQFFKQLWHKKAIVKILIVVNGQILNKLVTLIAPLKCWLHWCDVNTI